MNRFKRYSKKRQVQPRAYNFTPEESKCNGHSTTSNTSAPGTTSYSTATATDTATASDMGKPGSPIVYSRHKLVLSSNYSKVSPHSSEIINKNQKKKEHAESQARQFNPLVKLLASLLPPAHPSERKKLLAAQTKKAAEILNSRRQRVQHSNSKPVYSQSTPLAKVTEIDPNIEVMDNNVEIEMNIDNIPIDTHARTEYAHMNANTVSATRAKESTVVTKADMEDPETLNGTNQTHAQSLESIIQYSTTAAATFEISSEDPSPFDKHTKKTHTVLPPPKAAQALTGLKVEEEYEEPQERNETYSPEQQRQQLGEHDYHQHHYHHHKHYQPPQHQGLEHHAQHHCSQQYQQEETHVPSTDRYPESSTGGLHILYTDPSEIILRNSKLFARQWQRPHSACACDSAYLRGKKRSKNINSYVRNRVLLRQGVWQQEVEEQEEGRATRTCDVRDTNTRNGGTGLLKELGDDRERNSEMHEHRNKHKHHTTNMRDRDGDSGDDDIHIIHIAHSFPLLPPSTIHWNTNTKTSKNKKTARTTDDDNPAQWGTVHSHSLVDFMDTIDLNLQSTLL